MSTFGRIVLDGIEPVIYPSGIPIVGATLQVNITGAGLATIYSDYLGATPILNPQTSDSAGRFYLQTTTIWADMSAAYDLTVTYPAGGSTTYTNIYPLGAPVSTSGFLTNPNANLTGVPTVPTAALNNASSQAASTQFVQNAINAISIFPPGFEFSCAVALSLSGWQLEDGTAISRTGNPVLFGLYGTTFGAGDMSTTFNVPDMRGYFPRGVNPSGAGHGPTTSAGTVALDQIQDHQHGLLTGQASYWARATSGGGQGAPSGSGAEETVSTGAANVAAGGNGTPRTGSETCPAYVTKYWYVKLG